MRRVLAERGALLAAVALFVGALLVALLRVVALSPGSGAGGLHLGADWAMVDFRAVIYEPTTALLRGVNPYAELNPPYLPSNLLLHLPFGLLPLEWSQLCYAAISVGLMLGIAYLTVRLTGSKGTAATVFLVAALLTLSRPGQWNLLLGQVTLQAVLASYVALRYAPHAPLLSGIALAVSTFKPSFGIPLAILMLARGSTRAVVIAVVAALCLNLPVVAALVHVAGGVGPLVESTLRGYRAWSTHPDVSAASSSYRLDGAAILGRVVGPLGGVGQLVVAAIVLGTAALALRRIDKLGRRDTAGLADGIVFSAVLLSVYHMGYDLILLTLPVVAVARRQLPASFERPRLRVILLALFALLGANYGASRSVIERLGPGSPLSTVVALINGLLLSAVFALFVSAAFAAARRPEAEVADGGLALSRPASA